MNLVLNAVDAIFGMPEDSPKGHVVLRAALDTHKNELCIMVQDNGPGMPKPILDNLREIFRRVQASADALSELQAIAETVQSTKNQGYKEHYGLGFLFVCQTIQQHRGRLAIDAEPGKGTRFVIAIPSKKRRVDGGWRLKTTGDADDVGRFGPKRPTLDTPARAI